MLSWRIPKGGTFVQAVMPQDLNGVALQGPFVSLKTVTDLLVIIVLDTAATEPVITLEQATDASGTGAKALPISDINMLIATDLDAATDDEWNLVEAVNRTNPVDTYDTAGSGISGKQAIVVVRVSEEDLDDEGGFTFLRINTPAIATERFGHVAYLAQDRNYRGAAKAGI